MSLMKTRLVTLAIPVLGIAGAVVGLAGLFDPAGRAEASPAPVPQEKFRVAGRDFESREAFLAGGRRCDTPIPTENQVLRSRRAAAAVRKVAGASRGLDPSNETTVRVCFHVIHKGDEGKLARGQLDKQVEVLNKAYTGSGLKFATESVDFTDVAGTDDEDWYTMGHGSPEERAAKRALGRDPKQFLNFYTADLSDSLLGWATFPSDLAGDPEIDGVVVLNTSLPAADGGPNPDGGPFGLGQTASHEAGHWVGLYHTFQGFPDPCDTPGDEVDDTPPHRGNSGCPGTAPDSCPGGGADPIHNYMNYTDDACMTEFTPGQIRRAREQMTTFRPLLFSIPADTRTAIRRAAAGR